MSTPNIRGLTLWRPWAAAIVHGPKAVENRPWAPPARLLASGLWIAVHAGRRWDGIGAKGLESIWPEANRHPLDEEGVVGVAQVLDAVEVEDLEREDPWAFGPWCWLLGARRALPQPIPCRGAQGLWTLPPEVLAAVAPLCGGGAS